MYRGVYQDPVFFLEHISDLSCVCLCVQEVCIKIQCWTHIWLKLCVSVCTGVCIKTQSRAHIIIMIIINLIYIAQFDTNGILTALYIVITYIQIQYVHIWPYISDLSCVCLCVQEVWIKIQCWTHIWLKLCVSVCTGVCIKIQCWPPMQLMEESVTRWGPSTSGCRSVL